MKVGAASVSVDAGSGKRFALHVAESGPARLKTLSCGVNLYHLSPVAGPIFCYGRRNRH